MGKSKRNRNRSLAASMTAIPELSDPAAVDAGSMNFSGYQGANYSLNRGQLFWPTLETRDELDSYSHFELIRRIRWLAANVGFIKGFIRNAATLVGSLTPQSTVEGEWAELAEKAFWRVAGNKMAFDRSGKFNFHTAQKMLTRQSLRDGDVLTVLTEARSSGAAMFAFYEAHQIKQNSKGDEIEKQGWYSGVRINQEGRHIEYALTQGKDSSAKVPADRCIYFGDFVSAGNRRAIPPLAHAVNHGVDVVEVWANIKSAIKNSSLFAAVRERENLAAQKSQAGMPGSLLKGRNPNAPGEFNVAEVWSAGQIPQLPPGEKLKILHDSRPATEQMNFINTLLTDVACGFGLPLEIIWKISDLKSSGVRFVMEVASLWIKERQDLLEDWCRRVWVYVLAKEMKAGRLPVPPDGVEWWAVDFVPMRDITIDRGREGKMKMEEVALGMGTFSAYHREKGQDWKDEARQRVNEAKYHMELCEAAGIPYQLVFAPRSGQAPVDMTQSSTE